MSDKIPILVGVVAFIVICAGIVLGSRADDEQRDHACIAAFSRVHAATDTTAILIARPACGDVLRGAR